LSSFLSNPLPSSRFRNRFHTFFRPLFLFIDLHTLTAATTLTRKDLSNRCTVTLRTTSSSSLSTLTVFSSRNVNNQLIFRKSFAPKQLLSLYSSSRIFFSFVSVSLYYYLSLVVFSLFSAFSASLSFSLYLAVPNHASPSFSVSL